MRRTQSRRRATGPAAAARPVQRSMTPDEQRRWGGGALVVLGFLALIVPGLRDGFGAVFGIAWPLAAFGAIGLGAYIACAARVALPRARLIALLVLAFGLLGLVAGVSWPAGGMVGGAALGIAAPFGGSLLLVLAVAVAVVVALPLNWRGLAVLAMNELGEHAPKAGAGLVRWARRRLTPVPEMRTTRAAPDAADLVPACLPTGEALRAEGVPAGQVMAGADEGGEPEQHDLPLEEGWRLPPLRLLAAPPEPDVLVPEELDENRVVIEETLAEFDVPARVVRATAGPAVTQYAIEPGPRVTVRKVTSRADELALALSASPLRFDFPVPGAVGRSAIGLEVPNKAPTLVTIREGVEGRGFASGRHQLGIVLGNDIAGEPVSADLVRLVHLLIAGATGQGKSVCLNTLICSLLFQYGPDRLRLVLVDPKGVELQGYAGLPHLAAPVIVNPAEAAAALGWAVGEVERRYRMLARENVRDLASYNARHGVQPMPYVVLVIDEFADLVMVGGTGIMELVCRLAQKARAAGVHLVIATQRPSTDVITGLVKANVPSRLALAVGSQVDSRVILDRGGAEKLLGRGDMLFHPVGAPKPTRIQGAFISDKEIEALTWHWRDQGEPEYLSEVLAGAEPKRELPEERRRDPLFGEAARAVATEGAASVSLLQRKLPLGYSRAGRLIDALAEHRVIGAYQGSKAREVLMTLPDVDKLLEQLGLEGGPVEPARDPV